VLYGYAESGFFGRFGAAGNRPAPRFRRCSADCKL